jgi:hypothetical protein
MEGGIEIAFFPLNVQLPYFIETLELSTFDLGTSVPKIVKVYQPKVDEWGIWCDFEVRNLFSFSTYYFLFRLNITASSN